MNALNIGVTIFAFALPMMGQTAPGPTYPGTVTDSHGVPVSGVEIAQFWLAGSETPSGFRAYGQIKSDATGKFHIRMNHLPATLFAVDAKNNQGAIVVVSEPAKEINVQLQPLWRVRYHFEGASLTNLSQSRITLKPASGSLFSQIAGPTEGVLLLPPGKYTVGISSPGAEQSEVNFEVTNHDLTLDPIPLNAGITQYYGHAAPPLDDMESISPPSFSTEELRGKWVLVYFWGYWCAPCVNEGLPKLAHFFEEHILDRDRFEILAVHENGVAGQITIEELKEKLAGLEKEKWGKPLPFRIVLDRSGETIKAWGVSAYPTIALIKPNGELMQGDLDTLGNELERK